jgi:hypothetical protein
MLVRQVLYHLSHSPPAKFYWHAFFFFETGSHYAVQSGLGSSESPASAFRVPLYLATKYYWNIAIHFLLLSMVTFMLGRVE